MDCPNHYRHPVHLRTAVRGNADYPSNLSYTTVVFDVSFRIGGQLIMENNFWLGMIWILDIGAILWAASVGFPPIALMGIFAVGVIVTCGNKAPGGE